MGKFRDEVEVEVACAPAGDAAANARAAGAEEGVGVGVELEGLVAAEELFPTVLLLLALLLLLITVVLDRWLPLVGREEVEMCAVRAPEGVMVVVTIAAGGGFLAFLAPRTGSWSESRGCGDGNDTGLGLEEGDGEGDLWLLVLFLLLFIVGLPETGTARETGLGGSGEVEREAPMLGPRGGKCAMDWGLRGIAAAGSAGCRCRRRVR